MFLVVIFLADNPSIFGWEARYILELCHPYPSSSQSDDIITIQLNETQKPIK